MKLSESRELDKLIGLTILGKIFPHEPSIFLEINEFNKTKPHLLNCRHCGNDINFQSNNKICLPRVPMYTFRDEDALEVLKSLLNTAKIIDIKGSKEVGFYFSYIDEDCSVVSGCYSTLALAICDGALKAKGLLIDNEKGIPL